MPPSLCALWSFLRGTCRAAHQCLMALEKGLSEPRVMGTAQALAIQDGHWAIRCTLKDSGKFRVEAKRVFR